MLERQILRDPSTKPRSAKYQVLSSPELVLYIEETRLDEETAQMFKLANLVELYQYRMQQLGFKLDKRVHSTRLTLVQFLDMRAHTKGIYVLLAYEQHVWAALTKAWELDSDYGVVHLACATTGLVTARHSAEQEIPVPTYICRDDVARSYTKEGVSRHVVTPGHEHLINPRS